MNRFSLLAVALLVGACSESKAPQPPEAPAVQTVAPPSTDGAPPTVGGLYIVNDACPGEGCYLIGKIRAYAEADLYDKAGVGAAVTGKVAAGEWVEIVSREEHLVPARGVVKEGRGHFSTGDVVYLLSSEGEGCYTAWSKGKLASWCDPEAVGDAAVDEAIVLDAQDGREPDGAGLWIRIRRDTGGEGWLRGARDFACTGYQDRDPDCPPLPQ